MKYILILLFISNTFYGQDIDIKPFGDKLAQSIKEKDSLAFYALIQPKEAILEKFNLELASKLSDKEKEYAINNINKNYEQLISSSFGLSFFNLTNKVDIFNLDLKNIKYSVVELDEVKGSGIIAIYGKTNNDKFPHFNFYVSSYKGELYLANPLIHISEVNKFEEIKVLKKVYLSSDKNGFLTSKGVIELDNRSTPNKEVLNCLLNSIVLVGIEESSLSIENKLNFEYITGKWNYTYYVNDSSNYAGIVEFKYELKILNGTIEYKYFDFIHSQDDSKYKSLGQLPYKINEDILGVFTEEQYNEIMKDILTNQILAVKRTKKITDKCFK